MSLPAAVLAERVIPVARGLNSATAPGLVEALRDGGIHSIEITVEGGDGAFDAIAAVAASGMAVGAGTIVNTDQATRATEAGAEFLVTPHFDPGLCEWATANNVSLIPGALTPTEVFAAWAHRPPAVKIFPAHVGGARYLKSLLGPYPDLALIPTGGVDAGNAGEFVSAGAVAVGVGGWLTAHDDLTAVTDRARRLLRQVV